MSNKIFDFAPALQTYLLSADEEQVDLGVRMQEFLACEGAPFSRETLSGHFTGSAFVVSRCGEYTLLVHHKKLGRWLQPGGHADGDTNLHRVAARELREETGVSAQELPLSNAIFDLDIHEIPQFNDVPAHFHFDVRFLFAASLESVIAEQLDEVEAVQWWKLEDLSESVTDPSVLRMAAKASRVMGLEA